MAGPIHGKVALTQYVHSEKSIELECVGQLDTDHLFENEGKAGCIIRGAIRQETDAKSISLYLPFPLSRNQGTFAQPI